MRILALWGSGESGKSSTILRLVGLMLADGAQLIECQQCNGSDTDWCFVLEYDNRTYGITTRGDASDMLEEDFNVLNPGFVDASGMTHSNALTYDRYVCATRTKEGTVKFVERHFAKSDIYWLRQPSLNVGTHTQAGKQALSGPYDVINRRQAELMLDILRR